MAIDPRQTALSILTDELCRANDDAYQAQRVFRSLSFEQMDEEYGQSGHTPRQLLNAYGERLDEVIAAMEWVRTQNGL